MHRNVPLSSVLLAPLVGMALSATALAEKPDFSGAIYGDGELWGTKATTELPAPNGRNNQSFDKLFVIVNGADGQMPVSEAAPGNPDYNGGRWFTHTVMWTQSGKDAYNLNGMELPVLKSYDEIVTQKELGNVVITQGPPDFEGAPPAYFQCPLLPVKY
jgi:hypothetical protein